MKPTTDLTSQQNNGKTETWSFLDLVIILIGTGIIFAICFFMINWLANPEDSNFAMIDNKPSAVLSIGLAAVEAVALLGGVYFFGLRRLHYSWKDIGFTNFNHWWLLATITISIIVVPLSGVITIVVMLALGLPLENPQLEFIIPPDFSWTSGIALFVLGGILVPIAEEVFFRGVLYRWLRERWGILIGVLVSSFIFGLIHVDIAIATTALVLGIILALVYEYSESLWTAILIHAINNSVKIFLIYIFLAIDIPM